MNPFSRTLKFVGAAGIAALLAAGSWYATQPSDVAGFGDVGQPFFPDFDDVEKTTALSVIDYDADQKEAASFSVKQNDDGLWVIPSHHDYPAEAKARLAKTATSLIGVKKSAVQSRSKDDWKRYGVVDPESDGAATAEERGTRLTLRDGSDNALIDLIVGNEVEGRAGNYYVRVPDNNTTFVSELDVDLSAKFSDWIEPDLLKITSGDIIKVTLDNYSINEERQRIEKKELLEFVKAGLDTKGDWQLADLNDETEEFDNSPVTSITSSLDQLKIVGVRPKPDGLNSNLRVNPAVKQILQLQMQSQGYFIAGDENGNERLYSNEGELIAGLSNGVEYTLYFGEIARGTGKDIEVGLSDDAKADDNEGEDSKDEESEDGPRRYLLVKVDFNETLLGDKPIPPLEPGKPEILKAAESEESETKEQPKEEPEAGDDAEPKEESDESEEADPCGAFDETAAQDEPVAADEPAADPPVKETPAEGKPADETPADKPTKEKAVKDEPVKDEPAKAEPKKAETTEAPKKVEEKKVSEEPKTEPKTDPKGDAKESGSETPAAKEEADPEKPMADEKAAAPVKEPAAEEPAAPAKDPKQIAQEQYDAAVAAYNGSRMAYERDLKAYEAKVEAGQEKVKELATRFGSWYYVISSDSFEKFRIERKDVVSAKAKDEAKPEDATEGAK